MTKFRVRIAKEAEEDLTEEQWDILSGIEDGLNAKVEGVAKFVKSLEADAGAVKAERQRLAAREKTLGRKVEWLKGYLLSALRRAGKDKVKGQILTVSLRKAPVSCTVVDQDAVPAEFKLETREVRVDRQALISHFKGSGELVDGVEFVTDKRFVQIR